MAGQGELSEETLPGLWAAVSRRAEGYPLQYLLGEWEFYGRPFTVGPGVLIPRADTETLIESVLSWACKKRGIRMADLCSGSGCIAVTLWHELNGAKVSAVENSPAALSYLRENIRRNHADVEVWEDDACLPSCPLQELDLVTANPPYLSEKDMSALQKEVSFEPEEALAGGRDGLDYYRRLTCVWKERICPGGRLFYEVGLEPVSYTHLDVYKRQGWDVHLRFAWKGPWGRDEPVRR